MKIDEWAAQVNGTIDAMLEVTSVMAASQPQAASILEALHRRVEEQRLATGASPTAQHYIAGMSTALRSLETAVSRVRSAQAQPAGPSH